MKTASPSQKTTSGFTLVELLVVIVVIGLLSAIAVPIFLSQSDKANDAALKSDLANAAKLLTIAYSEGAALPSEFPAGQSTDVEGLDGTVYGSLTPNTTLRVDNSGGGLCVTGNVNGTDFQTAGGTVSEGSCTLVSGSASEPGAPISLSATAGDGQVVLVWSAPQDDGGDPVTGYTVEYSNSAEGPWTEFETTTETTSTVTGLNNSTAYYFQVTAANQVGASAATSSTATPVIIPGAIEDNFDITFPMSLGDGWNVAFPPADTNGGSAIVEYIIQTTPDNRATWEEYQRIPAPAIVDYGTGPKVQFTGTTIDLIASTTLTTIEDYLPGMSFPGLYAGITRWIPVNGDGVEGPATEIPLIVDAGFPGLGDDFPILPPA